MSPCQPTGQTVPVFLMLKRPEGYEDVHPDLVLEDAGVHADFRPQVVGLRSPVTAIPVAWISADDLERLTRGEDNVVACSLPPDPDGLPRDAHLLSLMPAQAIRKGESVINPDRAAIRALVDAGHLNRDVANEALCKAHGFSKATDLMGACFPALRSKGEAT